MFNFKRFFFPYDAFSQSVLTLLSKSKAKMTITDLYIELDESTRYKDPSIGRIMFVVKRMESRGFINTKKFDGSDARSYYSISQEGMKLLDEVKSFKSN